MAGKYDIVYMVKDSAPNEELRYSLRSIEKNWQSHGDIWFFGGCPEDLEPDFWTPVVMIPTIGKWENTYRQMRLICECDEITDEFWFFNDDFFVMHPTTEDLPQQYNGLLQDVIREVESYSKDESTMYWTNQLRVLIDWAEREGYGTVNYEVHKPMLINRKKMLAVMNKYPDVLFTRSLYGNYYKIGGENTGDIMIKHPEDRIGWIKDRNSRFLSTTEESFADGKIGEYIRSKFPQPSRWEV